MVLKNFDIYRVIGIHLRWISNVVGLCLLVVCSE